MAAKKSPAGRGPDARALAARLGRAHAHWTRVIDTVAEQHGPLDEVWSHNAKTDTWGLRLIRRRDQRTVLYLLPGDGVFLASFALGEKACAAAKAAGLAPAVLAAIEAAPRYAEGRGVRLTVRSARDAAQIVALAAIKLAN